jgi:propanol-preferring alcohol dehydrogenase
LADAIEGRAMVLPRPGAALESIRRSVEPPGPGQVRLAVLACGVCRTDLHIVDGDLEAPSEPRVLGHEIVAEVVDCGPGVSSFGVRQRVGVPWLGETCGACAFCASDAENLCDAPRFTGWDVDGGFAEHTLADARYCFSLDPDSDPAVQAPLLCAGLIGYRSYAMVAGAKRVGVYGFGAAAHLIAQVILHEGGEVYAFTRPGDTAGQDFARALGVQWAGDSDAAPPCDLDAALLFAPVGSLVPTALAAVRKGGSVICAGIHMSDIPAFDYARLWGERTIRSVANLTRRDGKAFLEIAARIPIRPTVTRFPLAQANEALAAVREGKTEGAIVLIP